MLLPFFIKIFIFFIHYQLFSIQILIQTYQKYKIEKKGAIREVAKQLTDLRKKPLSKKIFEILILLSLIKSKKFLVVEFN